MVICSERTKPVFVTLNNKRRDDGDNGERDLVLGVEHVRGGAGDDAIVGNSKENEIEAGAGDDVVRGNGGRDMLSGDSDRGCSFRSSLGGGDERLYGGRGRDSLFGCGGNDVVHGGRGRTTSSGRLERTP